MTSNVHTVSILLSASMDQMDKISHGNIEPMDKHLQTLNQSITACTVPAAADDKIELT